MCFVEGMLKVVSFSVVERMETFTGGSVIPLVRNSEFLLVLLLDSENTNGLL